MFLRPKNRETPEFFSKQFAEFKMKTKKMSSLLEPTVPQHSADAISDPNIKHFFDSGI